MHKINNFTTQEMDGHSKIIHCPQYIITLRTLIRNLLGSLQQTINFKNPIIIDTAITHMIEEENFLNYLSDTKTTGSHNLMKPNNSLKIPLQLNRFLSNNIPQNNSK